MLSCTYFFYGICCHVLLCCEMTVVRYQGPAKTKSIFAVGEEKCSAILIVLCWLPAVSACMWMSIDRDNFVYKLNCVQKILSKRVHAEFVFLARESSCKERQEKCFAMLVVLCWLPAGIVRMWLSIDRDNFFIQTN